MKKILIFLSLFFSVFFPCRAFAALAIDASSPPSVNNNTYTVTTASFTPPAGSVLYILIGLNSTSSSHNKVTNVSDNLGGSGLSYTQVLKEGTENGNDTVSYLYTATVSTAQAMTVSVTQFQNFSFFLWFKVLVITGASTASSVGASGGGKGATGVINDSYVSTANNSWGWLVYSDWHGVGIPTAGAGQTVYDSFQDVGDVTSYAIIQQNSTTASSGTSVTMSTTAPVAGAQTAHLYFEMKPVSVSTNSVIQGNSNISGKSTIY